MMGGDRPRWLDWAREIQAIGQSGLHFCKDEFDRQRYSSLISLSAEILSEYMQVPANTLETSFLSQEGYATPKVDVRAAVFHEGQILLVQERSDGGWSMPGGWADINEPPSAMVEREVREESGFNVRAKKIVAVYESNHDREPLRVYHAYKVVFLCQLINGSAQSSIETSAVQFFPLDQLPKFSPYRTTQRMVTEAYAHLHDPNRPAAFD